eukprot:gene6949-7729_t
MELNDPRGAYSSPDADQSKSSIRRSHYFVSKKRMIFIVVIFVCLFIVSAVVGTVISHKASPNGKSGSSSAYTNRSRKGTGEPEPKPDGPWKNFRLPKNLKPLHYDLKIRVNMSDALFYGVVRIRFAVVAATSYIILHVDPTRMHYKRLVVTDMSNRPIERKTTMHHASFLFVEMNENLQQGLLYTITINYYSDFKNYPQKGLYWVRNRSLYNPATRRYVTQKKMAVTFFAPISARRNFPCFDEPGFKATFSLMLIYSRGYTSLSNMPLVTSRMTKSLVFDRFKTSLRMPTYMLNYVISDYSSSGTVTKHGTKLRLWSPKYTAKQRSYGLRAANLTLPYYEGLFGVRYPISKLDLITVPTYLVAAMETWGLVNFVERKLLLQGGSDSNLAMRKQKIVLLVAHEIVHQWFGNLATIKWWTDLVIHEGCATYLQYFGANYVEPQLELMDQFYNIEVRQAMQEDSRNSSREIAKNVLVANDIGTNIHILMYRKGAAILRMLHSYIGDRAFIAGLRLYVKRFAYASATQDDLWQAISETSNVDVGSIMKPWTKQPGFPIVTAKRINSEEVLVTQKRFLVGYANDGSIGLSNWKVPITYATSNDPKRKQHILLSSSNTRLTVGDSRWFKLNKNADGYYIVNYDDKNWNRLGQQLTIDHSVFSILDRSSLLKDVFTLAEEGVLPSAVAMNMTVYLPKEEDWIPWQYVKYFISNMIMRLPRRSKTRQLLLQYNANITKPLLEKYGWDEIKDGSLKENFLQETAVTAAMNAGDKQAVDMAKRLFRNWMVNQTRIQPNIAKVVLFYGVRNGGKEEWNRVFTMFSYEVRKTEKAALMGALGASKDSWTLTRLLQLSTYSRHIYIVHALQVVAASGENGRNIAWNFVKRKWQTLPGSNNIDYAIRAYMKPIAGTFSNIYYYNDVQKFLKKRFGHTALGMTRAKELLKVIQMNILWSKKVAPEIRAWLEKHSKAL